MTEKSNMFAITLGVIAIIIAFVLFLVRPQQLTLTTEQIKDTIAVTGTATLSTSPDQAEILLNVKSEATTAQYAKNINAEKSVAVRNALKNTGLAENEIETISFNVYPKYRYEENSGRSILDGYVVENVMKIKTEKIESAGKFIDAAVDNGALINGISFTLSLDKQREINAQVLKEASANAKVKAESITSSLGVKLGKIASISEYNVYSPTPRYYSADMMLANSEASIPTEVTPGQIEVTGQVSVSYYIN